VHRPFREPELKQAKAFVVGFAAAPLGAKGTKCLAGFECEDERFHVRGRELYWMSRVGQGTSQFSAAKLEKALGAQVTFRGMNTVQRLAAKYPSG